MKYTDFKSVLPVLAKNKSKNIILVGNNATPHNMHQYLEANSINKKNIAFGFQVSGGKKYKEHISVLRINSGEMILGSLKGDIKFKEELSSVFNDTRYKLTYESNINDWLISHIIFIMPLNIAHYINNNNYKLVGKIIYF